MTPSALAPPHLRDAPPDLAARRLSRAAAVVLVLLPVVMVVANRASPLVVGIAAALALAAALAESGWRLTLADLAAPLAGALGLTALAFLGWCLLSLAWTPVPATSLRALREFVPTLLGAYVLARLLPHGPAARPAWPAALAVALACAGIAASLASDLWLQQRLGMRAALFVMNRPVMVAALLLFPLAALLLARGGAGRPARIATAAALAAVVVATALRSMSGAASLGLLAGGGMALLAALLPARAATALAGLALGTALALAPVEGDLLAKAMPDAVQDRLSASSPRARIAIARSFGAAVAADPWRGAGFGTSPDFDRTPVAERLPPEMRELLKVGHPHNVALQIWAELGLVGAVLAGALLFLALARIAALPRAARIAGLGLMAAAAAIAYVEHGAWQAWWTAALGAAIAWLRVASDAGERSTT